VRLQHKKSGKKFPALKNGAEPSREKGPKKGAKEKKSRPWGDTGQTQSKLVNEEERNPEKQGRESGSHT